MGDIVESPFKCDVTGNPVGTDTVRIGFVCGCQGCRAHREIQRLRAEVERLQGAENGMSTETVGSYAVGHLREMYRAAYDALGPSGRVSLRNHIDNMVRRRDAEAMERAAQIADGATVPVRHHPSNEYLPWPIQHRDIIAAAIRAEASKKGGEG